MLQTAFARVISAFTADHAMRLVSSCPFSLAVIDVLLPGGRSGIDIAAECSTMGTPVLLTGGSFEAVPALRRFGFSVLQKPISMVVLCGEALSVLADGEAHRMAQRRAAALMEAETGRRR